MGRYYGSGFREELDGMLWIDATKLNQWNYFSGFNSGTLTWTHKPSGTTNRIGITVNTYVDWPFVRLNYTATDRWSDEKTDYDYQIELTSTPCNFGGKRWWFICPLVVEGRPCRRRVRVLYKRDKYFGCRTCQQLCYSAQNENHHYGYAGLFKTLEYEQKAEELRGKIKVPYYNGRPTRKMRRYLVLRKKSAGSHMVWEKLDDLLRP